MYKSKSAALFATACIITISLIYLVIKEACYSQVQASSFLVDNNKQKVVLILADYLELQDFAENEYLDWLYNNSHSALVSGRQNGKASSIKAKLTVGASKRLEISSGLKSAVNDINSHNTDKNPIRYIDINSLFYQNQESDYRSYIGYLGSRLHLHNKTTCVIGNSDADIIDRSAVLIAMDEKGIVDEGDVEQTLLEDVAFPGGRRTDYNKLYEQYEKYIKSSDFMVVDTGDLARLESHKNELTVEAYHAHRAVIIANIAELTKKIIESSGTQTSIAMLSTYPSKKSLKSGFKLTPFVVYDRNPSGFLYSASTKREGIITNLDIADYFLYLLTDIDKSTLSNIASPTPLKSALMLARRLLNVSGMRLPVLTWYAILEIVCATVGLIFILHSGKTKLTLIMPLDIIMVINIVAPAILLYLSIFNIDNKIAYFIVFILLSLIIAILLSILIKSTIGKFLGAALFVNVSIIIDLLRGSAYIKNSLFGYDPIIGARFYGIGNEFAGVFIGSGILLAGCLLQHYKGAAEEKPKTTAILITLFSIFQLLMIGMPFVGANFGGTIAGVVGYFFFYCSVRQSKIKVKQLILLTALLIFALSIIIFWDLSKPGDPTHVGRFINDIEENGVRVLYATFERKIEMNIKLIKYTIWTKVLLCIILIITIMFFKPVRLLHWIFRKYNYLAASWLGISAGSIAGLIANDSGIVMAATAMIFTGYTILYICLEERSASN